MCVLVCLGILGDVNKKILTISNAAHQHQQENSTFERHAWTANKRFNFKSYFIKRNADFIMGILEEITMWKARNAAVELSGQLYYLFANITLHDLHVFHPSQWSN